MTVHTQRKRDRAFASFWQVKSPTSCPEGTDGPLAEVPSVSLSRFFASPDFKKESVSFPLTGNTTSAPLGLSRKTNTQLALIKETGDLSGLLEFAFEAGDCGLQVADLGLQR